jgi:nuclear-control-of-ATPase protein 2
MNDLFILNSRLERVLIAESDHSMNDDIPASTTGLLLLSVTRLRTFAETCLPAHSQLREGFLEDVSDLEDPKLKRGDKLRVVDRMWRSWGSVLKWGSIVEELR